MNPPGAVLTHVPIDRIMPGRNPRTTFDGIPQLAESIRAVGLLCPPMVERVGKSYQLIAGDRRTQAVRLLREQKQWPTETIPVLVVRYEADPAGVLATALAENVSRSDLRPWETARAVADLERVGMKSPQIAKAIGKTQGWIQRYRMISRYLTPAAIALLRQLPPDITTAPRVEALCKLRDDDGDGDAELQVAMIREGWPTGSKLGRYDRTLDRRRTSQRIAILKAKVLPLLDGQAREAAQMVVDYLLTPGPVKRFSGWHWKP